MGTDTDVVLPIDDPLIPVNLVAAGMRKEYCAAEVSSSRISGKILIPDLSPGLVDLVDCREKGLGVGLRGQADPDKLQQRGLTDSLDGLRGRGPDALRLFVELPERVQRPNPVRESIQIANDSTCNPESVGRDNLRVSWANVVQGKKLERASDLLLSFVPPSIINGEKAAVCPIEEKEENLKVWKNTLVGYLKKALFYISEASFGEAVETFGGALMFSLRKMGFPFSDLARQMTVYG